MQKPVRSKSRLATGITNRLVFSELGPIWHGSRATLVPLRICPLIKEKPEGDRLSKTTGLFDLRWQKMVRHKRCVVVTKTFASLLANKDTAIAPLNQGAMFTPGRSKGES